ncbi:hypothetical protein QLL95_gp0642 [Cotonvirus japonicus]|uniref:Uncharacterized protein n=1 Tax=Cotonvirus japonicus TaxID=2811091 RepID=A0ABM7NTQ5_9VIRU|nr:hypothetical protein QLL95_gp0642 [Cotonvirus japonicus]BCS83481.1 hypothetical protein [Cotonvirus japonicus]
MLNNLCNNSEINYDNMENKNFIVKFSDCDKIYSIPLDIINKYPGSYFASIIRFENKFECTISSCSYQDFEVIFLYMMSNKKDITIYVTNYQMIDYFCLQDNIIDNLFPMINIHREKIINFLEKGSIMFTNVEEYNIYKNTFKDNLNIIPIHYITMDKNIQCGINDYKKSIRDGLFCGNSKIVDFGEVNINRFKHVVTYENYFNTFISNVQNKMSNKLENKSVIITSELVFNWLNGIDIENLTDIFLKNFNVDNFYDSHFGAKCITKMSNIYKNEIQYLIDGINKITEKYTYTDQTSATRIRCYRKNLKILKEYMEKFNNKNNIKYPHGIVEICSKYFPLIRKTILNDEIVPSLCEKIITIFQDDGDQTQVFNDTVAINVYLGFINTKNMQDNI